MKTLAQRLTALLLSVAGLLGSGAALADEPATPLQPPVTVQLAWDRVGSPMPPVA